MQKFPFLHEPLAGPSRLPSEAMSPMRTKLSTTRHFESASPIAEVPVGRPAKFEFHYIGERGRVRIGRAYTHRCLG